jgi:hypothetical protein
LQRDHRIQLLFDSKPSPDLLNEAAETRAEDLRMVLSRAVRGLARACAAPWHDLPASLVRCMNIYICIHEAASGAKDGYNITTNLARSHDPLLDEASAMQVPYFWSII